MKLTPTTLENRIESLDMMRGFALLGIFMANMLLFHTPLLYIDPFTWFSSPSDIQAFKWLDIFIEGSFYPIFAMLFGYGINMQYEKARANKTSFAPVLVRRLGLLALFGLIHGILIWSGDVLFPYAIMGLLMVALVRIPAKWLMTIAVVVYVGAMGLFIGLIRLLTKLDPNALLDDFADLHQIELSISAYAHGSFIEILSFRFQEWLFIGLVNGVMMGFFIILPIIMIGAALSKWKVIERAAQMKGRLAIVLVVALLSGIWIKALPHIGKPTYDLILLQDTFGGVILATGYVGVLLLLCTLPVFQKVFRPVAKAGRMSLTTYIMQSIIATLIFYSYGFGLYGKVDLVTGTWIAIGVFVIQVIFAELWLSKFKMGPLEWLWRKGTYGKISSK